VLSSTIRYIGPQCERCLQCNAHSRAVTIELIAASKLGAYAHRRWPGIMHGLAERSAVYEQMTEAGTLAYVRTLPAKQLHVIIAEYLVGATVACPPLRRAATCMVGGYN
jgi:hypothetical protein